LFQGLYPIISNEELMPGVYLVWADSPEIASTARPGQFAMIRCDNSFKRLLRRPISIHQIKSNAIAFLFAAVGEGTEWLARLQRGEKLDMLGPLGNGFSLNPEARHILIVAGGMGIAPLVFLAHDALKNHKDVKILAGAGSGAQVYPYRLIPEGVDYVTITEDGTGGEKGLVTDLLASHSPWADQIFICGPLAMYQAISRDYPRFLRNKPAQVSLEVRMGCGLGFCYACTIRTKAGLKQVCKDGPVFSMQDVLWEELR
jgi:dihydroorotate dehydrogenase electron transfer subunit